MLLALVRVISDVGATPTTAGMPGAALIQQLLNWLSQLALFGSFASVLVGAAVYGVSQQTGHLSGGYRGKQLVLAGAAGACLAGLAPTIINLLFKAASV